MAYTYNRRGEIQMRRFSFTGFPRNGKSTARMRASGPPLVIGYVALLCASYSLSFALPVEEMAIVREFHWIRTIVITAGWAALFLFIGYPRDSKTIRGKQLRNGELVIALGGGIAILAASVAFGFQSWVPLAIGSLSVGSLAVASIFWFMKGATASSSSVEDNNATPSPHGD